jgi:hypothetical protein
MNEARLRTLLREAPVPASEEAERRGLDVLETAFEERQPRRAASSPRRLAIALALAVLLGALLLSPAGASVRDWVGDVFTATPRPEPGLAEIPGGGRLLVQSHSGPWVVQPDGSRRLLGEFEQATWSPRGLYVAAVSGRTLSALEPDGTPRWSLSADGPIADPRWSPSGYRIAYRSGPELRVVDADGSDDRLIDPRAAPVAPVWSPLGLPQLAYVDAAGELRIADSESGAALGSAPALAGIGSLDWGSSGILLEASRSALRVRAPRIDKLAQSILPGPTRTLPLPPGAVVRDAAISPQGKLVAALLSVRGPNGPRSLVSLLIAAGGEPRRLLSVPGQLSGLAWSPNGERLLISWPQADQWLFLPSGRGQPRALGGISRAFAPGARDAAFPQVEGWCCRPWIGNRG